MIQVFFDEYYRLFLKKIILFLIMKFHQYDFRWFDETSVEIQASLGDKFGRKKLSRGDELSIEIQSEPCCAGHRIQDVWAPCPDKAKGKAKCEVCRAREQKESFVYTIFDGFNTENLTPEELQQISGPHVVYLAYFSPDLIKVGVSKKERQTMRQIEQGAYATLFIAEGLNGIDARQIETTLRKNGIQDKVLGSQKKNTFVLDTNKTESEKNLRQMFDRHKEIIEKAPKLQSFLKKEPLFQCWESVYNLPEIRENKKPIHPVKLENGEWVSGTILSIKGSFLLLETPHELIELNMKNLNGYEIEFDKKSPGISLNSAMQSVLF